MNHQRTVQDSIRNQQQQHSMQNTVRDLLKSMITIFQVRRKFHRQVSSLFSFFFYLGISPLYTSQYQMNV